jgi:D-alanyl-D-alanine carboxypeptidase/D-alanyl-D-alanine-endopeptidase (penicillin-binding protein 4)
LAEILAYMSKGPNREAFFSSLPLAGVTGTLDSSFRGTPLENNLRAKTGSMKRVRSLAGLFESKKGKEIIFAIIVNNFEGQGITRELEDFMMNLYANN